MDINKESIFDTRPWIVFGEGPSAEFKNPVNAQGFNEGKIKQSSKDIRFNQKGDILYVTVLGVPGERILINTLGVTRNNGKVKKIEVLGSPEEISWKQHSDALVIEKPSIVPSDIAIVLKVQLQ